MTPTKINARKEGGKKKKVMITVEVKKEIIEMYERGRRVAEIARFYNKSTSTICTILKKREEIMGLDTAKGITRVSTQRPRVLEYLEKLLLLWIREKQLAGATLTENLICEKAKTLYADLVSSLSECTENEEGFKASRGWFNNFKKRSVLHSFVGQEKSNSTDDMAATNEFLKKRKLDEDKWEPRSSSMADGEVSFTTNMSNSDRVTMWLEKLNHLTTQQMHFAEKFIYKILVLASQEKLHESFIHFDEDAISVDDSTVYDAMVDQQSDDETMGLDNMEDLTDTDCNTVEVKEELPDYSTFTENEENDTKNVNLYNDCPIEYIKPESSQLLEIKQEQDEMLDPECNNDEEREEMLNENSQHNENPAQELSSLDKHCKEKLPDDFHMIDQKKDSFYYFGLCVGEKLRKINEINAQRGYSCEKVILDVLYNASIEISSNHSNIGLSNITVPHNIQRVQVSV